MAIKMVSRGEKGNLCVTPRAIKESFLRNDFYLSLLLLDNNNDHLKASFHSETWDMIDFQKDSCAIKCYDVPVFKVVHIAFIRFKVAILGLEVISMQYQSSGRPDV